MAATAEGRPSAPGRLSRFTTQRLISSASNSMPSCCSSTRRHMCSTLRRRCSSSLSPGPALASASSELDEVTSTRKSPLVARPRYRALRRD
eukprot:5639614-Lingulodinium_polyedra.AAC.1